MYYNLGEGTYWRSTLQCILICLVLILYDVLVVHSAVKSHIHCRKRISPPSHHYPAVSVGMQLLMHSVSVRGLSREQVRISTPKSCTHQLVGHAMCIM